MCGIAGRVDFRGGVDQAIVARMTACLAHRGPDGDGLWRDDTRQVAFGHRRLAVIDLDPRAAQPMLLEAGSHVLTFNGEIYNFRKIRADLQAVGETFTTESDTEVLLKAWRQWGTQTPERLIGMFAFALWDAAKRTLFLVRDRMGEKPLYYLPTKTGLTFASELGAFRVAGDIALEPDLGALRKYLELGYILGEQSALSGIKRLPAGTVLCCSPDGAVLRSYWDLANVFRGSGEPARQPGSAAEELRAAIDRSVRAELVSDVPLGAFLSGGIDSATIAAAMAAQGTKPHAFTMDFSEKGFSELDRARRSAAHSGCDLRVGVPEDEADGDLTAEYDRIAGAADEPFADTSMFPTYQMARFTRRHVTVALSGDGGDEVFAGYVTYKADRLHRYLSGLPPLIWRGLRRAADLIPASHGKVGFDYKLKGLLDGLPLSASDAHWSWRRLFDDRLLSSILHSDARGFLELPSSRSDFQAHHDQASGLDALSRAIYVDMKTWLVDDILYKVDRMSMAHSLEVRAPFLDHRLLSLAGGYPAGWKLRGGTSKWILRESQRGRVHPDVLRAPKRGFNAPVSHWFQGALGARLLDLAQGGTASSMFVPAKIEALLADHRARRADHGYRLFALLGLFHWLERLKS